jgi:hypothetical protein
MAVNPSFTNANATTIFPQFGSGLGFGTSPPEFPQGIAITSNGMNERYINIAPGIYWGQNSLTINEPSVGASTVQAIGALNFFAQTNGSPAKSATYGATSIFYQGSNGSGNNGTFLRVYDLGLNDTLSSLAFEVSCVSSVQSGSSIVNCEAMLSTIKGNNWG